MEALTVERLQAVQLEEGDVVVYGFAQRLTYEQVQRIKATHEAAFPGTKGAVIDDGGEIAVVRPEALPSTAREL